MSTEHKRLSGAGRIRCAACGIMQSVIVPFPRLPGVGICESCVGIAARVY